MTYRVCDTKTTFQIHNVEPATTILDEALTGDVLVNLLSTYDRASRIPLLSWSDYNSKSVSNLKCHAFFAAVHMAFSQHRPLVISPDMVWIIIMQGLAQHIRNNAESMRDKMVFHAGRMRLAAVVGPIQTESPEAAWEDCVSALMEQLGANVIDNIEDLRCDFSTTGAIERTVCDIALLDVFESYFDYTLYSVCGFPSITLEGTVADWKRICEKIEMLAKYEIDWWLNELRFVTQNFANAAAGNVDRTVWRDMYKREDRYGATLINGWILKLIPYVKGADLSVTEKNPLIDPQTYTDYDGSELVSDYLSTSMLPSGVSCVPFTLCEMKGSEEVTSRLQMLGGFTGVQQDRETLSLRPRLGWAVRRCPLTEWLPEGTIVDCTVMEPISVGECDRIIRTVGINMRHGFLIIPNGFANFYRQCDGVTLFATNESRGARIYSMNELTVEEESDEEDDYDLADQSESDYQTTRIRVGYPTRWITFAELADGCRVVLAVGSVDKREWDGFTIFKVGESGEFTPLASDMTEFCKRFMQSRGNL